MADISKISLPSGTEYDLKDASARSGLAGKQDALVSGTNIKTINGVSLLGSGDLTISTGIALDELYDYLDTDVKITLAINYGWADKATFISQDEPTVFAALANIGNAYPEPPIGISDVTVAGTSVVTNSVAVIAAPVQIVRW